MPLKVTATRFAHQEGHCDVCYYSETNKGLITCGSDGDVRTWVDIEDDDPASGCIGEQVLCVLAKGENIYAGNDNNNIQILTHAELNKAGILTSFSSTVCAIASHQKSKLVASGSFDFEIKVTHIDSLETTELSGHEAPILGLSLDPKEVYVASSSADGTIKVWNIEKKSSVHTFFNVIPKANSFFSATVYGVPSFKTDDGKYLAYPMEKEVVIVERDTWTESFRLKHPSLKSALNICKFSECGKFLAASSLHGEVIVWNFEDREIVGHVAHPSDSKITAFAWKPDRPNAIAFCDMSGQLGCIEVEYQSSFDIGFGDADGVKDDNLANLPIDDDDEDNENAISLNKIKADAERDDDDRSSVSSRSARRYSPRPVLPEINLQECFQPTSTPSHLLTHFMVWNEVGIVTYYGPEEYTDSGSIEVEFHETATHHSMRIVNYMNHTMAALSTQALVLSCPSSDENPSKVVVVVLQGWGAGNKEWTIELPVNEESQCVAAGDNFVAVATSRRFLRIFNVGGVQREILRIPGSVVTMNAYKNQLVIVYHSGIGGSNDQNMMMTWYKISGRNLRSQTLPVPLSPESKLRWVGLTDAFVPAVYDTEDILSVYNQKLAQWTVVCDLKAMLSGQSDHYFLISISNGQASAICCKGTYYPVTSPRPFAVSVPLMLPLCEPEDEKTKLEAKIWQLDRDSVEQDSAMLELIALSCRKNAEYRVVDICQNLASQKVIELAIKYVARINRPPLVKKLQDIAESKYSRRSGEDNKDNGDVEMFEDFPKIDDDKDAEEEDRLDLISVAKKAENALRPLPFVNPRRSNPFVKTKASPKISGLEALGTRDPISQKVTNPSPAGRSNPFVKNKKNAKISDAFGPKDSISPKATRAEGTKENESGVSANKPAPKKETFVVWFRRVQEQLQSEHPEMDKGELTKFALNKFREEEKLAQAVENEEAEPESKKRKFEDTDDSPASKTPKTAAERLAGFARNT